MSSLIASKKPEPTLEVLPKHEVCGTCVHAQLIPQDIKLIMCFGAPPASVMVGAQQTAMGQQPVFMPVRPTLPRTERACGLWARKNALVVG